MEACGGSTERRRVRLVTCCRVVDKEEPKHVLKYVEAGRESRCGETNASVHDMALLLNDLEGVLQFLMLLYYSPTKYIQN